MIEWWLVDEAWLWFKNNIIFAMMFFLILFTTSAMTSDSHSMETTIQQLQSQINCMNQNQNHIIKYHQCLQVKSLQVKSVQAKENCSLPVFKNCFEDNKK